MLFERIESAGLAHYSYLVGSGHEALVIDPRRDCQVYVDRAAREGMRITHILETHRNEDYAIGSVELAARTGAEIWHADAQYDYAYGNPVADGRRWTVGDVGVRALACPGHTEGMMAYLLEDADGHPWAVCTGDALFAGSVGRVDLLGADRIPEMAGRLYDSITERLLPLGDGVIVLPAHGPGSACGASIAERPWTTLGIERRHNPALQVASREEFIERVGQALPFPPYFYTMERMNVEGPPPLPRLPSPPMLGPQAFADGARAGLVLDVRDALAFQAAHVPGALSIWSERLGRYGGWFLPYDRPLFLVAGDDAREDAVRSLARMGYDRLGGVLSGGMEAWQAAGLESDSLMNITVPQLETLLARGGEPWILDLRTHEEVERDGTVPGARHVPLTSLSERRDEVPREENVFAFCGTGVRSTIAASLLARWGWPRLTVVMGGMEGWKAAGAPRTGQVAQGAG
jgi:hydroxyacylglutathione hydrolase